MADELNIPTHRWYQPRNNIPLAKEDYSRQYIFDSGIQKIDAFIAEQPWGGGAFTPASLFASGEEGAWYEPSPTSTFTDIGGYTFATYGQTVSHLIDKSQGATIEARRNLLTYSEQFDNDAVWVEGSGVTVTPNDALDPNGDLTAERYQGNAGDTHSLSQNAGTSDPNHTISMWVKAVTPGSKDKFRLAAGGELSSEFTATADWQRFSFSPTTAGVNNFWGIIRNASSAALDVYIWGAQLEEGSTATAYQKITDGQTVSWLPGNHATQTTLASRPILARVPEGGRRNLLERTEEFDDAYWAKNNILQFGSGSIANATIAPDGTNTADKIVESTSTSSHWVSSSFAYDSSTVYTLSVFVKAAERDRFQLWSGAGIPRFGVVVDLTAESATPISPVGTATHVSSSILNVGNGWYRITTTGTMGTTGIYTPSILLDNGSGTYYTGDGTSGIYIWGAQLEQASSATAYQKVVTEYDITEAGVTSLDYLSFDGADDHLVLPNIPFDGDTGFNAFMAADTTSLQTSYRIAISRADGSGEVDTPAPYFGGNISYTPMLYDQQTTTGVAAERAKGAATRSNAVYGWQVSLTGASSRTAKVRINQTETSETYTRDNNRPNSVFNGLCAETGTIVQVSDVDVYGVIIRCAAPLELSIISQTEAYLAAKSGVTL